MRRLLLVFFGVLFSTSCSTTASAAIISTPMGFGASANSRADFGSGVDYQLGIWPESMSPPAPIAGTTIFDNLIIDESDVGVTFTATSSDDANFAAFVGRITNGSMDRVGETVDAGPVLFSAPRTESTFFYSQGTATGGNGIDLAGFSISSISLIFSEIDITGTNHRGVRLAGTISFDVESLDPVPEPSTLALLGIGSACMAFVGVRRRRKNKAA